MLDAGRAPQLIAGMSVFYDHADDRRRYVLPAAPRLLGDPEPRLSLTLYRGESSGGLLQLQATLAPSDSQLQAVERALAAEGRPATLARADWRNGSVEIAGWLESAELAPRSLFVGRPSLVGDPVAIIAAHLDVPGASLASASLKGNSLPTVLIFELETLGLAGPLGIEVEADLRAVHDRLTAEGALTTPYGRARLARTWEALARENVIRVRVVDESGDTEGRRAEAIRRTGEDLIARMFSPFPPAERPPQLDDGTVAPIELSFRLTKRREDLATSSRWDFRERRAVPLRHYAAAGLVDLLGDSPPSAHITLVDLDAARHEIVVRAEPALADVGIIAMEVDLRSAHGNGVEQTVTLTDAAPEVRLPREGPPQTMQYRVRARFDPARTRIGERESPWMATSSPFFFVSARQLFPPRTLTVALGRLEWDWLDHVEVTVETDGEAPRSMRLSSKEQSAKVVFPGAGDAPLSISAIWRGLRDEPTLAVPPVVVTADGFDTWLLDSPFADSMTVTLIPVPRPDVATTVVELRSEFNGLVQARTVSWDAPDRTPQRVAFRRLAGSPRAYSYRWELLRNDGTISKRPWEDSTATRLIIGAQGPSAVRTVEVVLLGGNPAAHGCMAVEFVLEAGELRATELLEGEQGRATLVLTVPKGAPPSLLLAREFLVTGEVRETRWTDPESLIVLATVA